MQQTIARSAELSGVALHSGQTAKIKLSPAEEDYGIKFIKGGQEISASLGNLVSTKRGTSLKGISVTEHLLAAIYGLGIDNVKIEVEGKEIPNLDGSSLPFVQALKQAGSIEQKAEKNYFRVKAPIKVADNNASLEALPYNGFRIDFMVNFPSVGEQKIRFELGQNDFSSEIAPARTFGYIEEHEALKKAGLGRGATEQNVLILSQKGYVNQPRFTDEPVRHKVLDLIGDLALLGQPILGHFKAVKSGHKLNTELMRRLKLS
ncbi:MAG: UDP-3-O-acyl-N-acetylglucosamine deacetylase [Candidatus Margulisbacteria bacterium]|nr:UDP-3-O-acyl-N-acetylglucosamine deacetylase [Candidatus Margulisiibacteriota bacterium]